MESNFGKRLGQARALLQLTQEALATRWGVDKNYIWMLEAGRKPFPNRRVGDLEKLETEARELASIELDQPRNYTVNPTSAEAIGRLGQAIQHAKEGLQECEKQFTELRQLLQMQSHSQHRGAVTSSKGVVISESDVKASLEAAGRQSEGLEPASKAALPTGSKGAPSARISPRPSLSPAPPTPVPDESDNA